MLVILVPTEPDGIVKRDGERSGYNDETIHVSVVRREGRHGGPDDEYIYIDDLKDGINVLVERLPSNLVAYFS